MILMDEAKFGNTELCKKGGKVNCKASVDSGASRIIGPAAVIDPYNKNVLKAPGNGAIKPVKCSDAPSFPNLEIKFGDEKLVLEPIYYFRKVNNKCYPVLFGYDDRWILGIPLLTKYYASFNQKDSTLSFYTKK